MTTTPDNVCVDLRQFVKSVLSSGNAEQPHLEDDIWWARVPVAGLSTQQLDVGEITRHSNIGFKIDLRSGSADERICIKNVPSKHTLRLQLEATGHGRTLEVGDLHGVVAFEAAHGTPHVNFAQTCDGEAQFESGEFKITCAEEGDVTLAIKGGNEPILDIQSRVPKLRLAGGCQLTTSSGGQIEELLIAGTCGIRHAESTLAVGSVKGDGETAVLRVEEPEQGSSARRQSDLGKREAISADVVSGVTLKCMSAHTRIGVKKRAESVTIDGPIWLDFAAQASADRLISRGNQATISAGRGAVITSLSGPWELRNVTKAHLSGGKNGFTIEQIRGEREPNRKQEQQVQGSVLTNFHMPTDVAGRAMLESFNNTYHLDPSPKGLPGSGSKYNSRRRPWRLDDDLQKRLPTDAEFVRELSRLARDKGAPGATRTRIAWCAYRLRHLASSSWWERRALDGYRLLGYGERPGPAFLTWLILAAFSAMITAGLIDGAPIDLSWEGAANYLRRMASYAIGPLGGLVGTGLPDADAWQYALRAIVAIPLITGALALRNYVKHGG